MIYGILLAAGQSSRMGRPKQLLDWHGMPLVRHVADQALASGLAGLVVVVGAAADEVRAALAPAQNTARADGIRPPYAMHIVENPDYAAGQAGSLRMGLAALPPGARAAVVLLVDQPLVTPELIDRLLAAYAADPEATAIVPHHRGQRGNPVLLAAPLFGELMGLEGDVGAREVLRSHADGVRRLELDDPAVTADADTPEAYETLRAAAATKSQQPPTPPTH